VKDNRIIFYANDELKDKLDKEAKEKMIKRSSLINKKLEDSYNEILENKYKSLDDACPLLVSLNEEEVPKKKGEGFYCLKRSPKEDKLGSGTIEAQKKYCDACQFRDGIIDYNKELIKKVERGTIVKIPSCIYGSQLSDDGKKLYCKNPKMSAQFRDVNNWCKNLRNGANCKGLRWATMTVKGKLTEKDNR